MQLVSAIWISTANSNAYDGELSMSMKDMAQQADVTTILSVEIRVGATEDQILLQAYDPVRPEVILGQIAMDHEKAKAVGCALITAVTVVEGQKLALAQSESVFATKQ